jgi:hypothetical protein
VGRIGRLLNVTLISTVTTVAVAWAAALIERRIDGQLRWVRSVNPTSVAVGYFGAATASIRIDRVMDDDADPVQPEWRPQSMRERMVLAWCLARFQPEGNEEVFVSACGWPFLAVCSDLDFDTPVRRGGLSGDAWKEAPWVWGARYGLNMPWMRRESFARLSEDGYECVSLPFVPLCPGFLANTVFYAVIWCSVLFVPGIARRGLCRRRNLCPRCAYDLRALPTASLCPECGRASAAS